MNWREAIANLDKSVEQYTNPEYICDQFGLSEYDITNWEEWDKRINQCYVKSWTCTDKLVGAAVIYLDDEPVAVSLQPSRKAREDVSFLSEEAAKKMKDFILSISQKPDQIDYVDLDFDLTDWLENYEPKTD